MDESTVTELLMDEIVAKGEELARGRMCRFVSEPKPCQLCDTMTSMVFQDFIMPYDVQRAEFKPDQTRPIGSPYFRCSHHSPGRTVFPGIINRLAAKNAERLAWRLVDGLRAIFGKGGPEGG